MEGWQQTAFAAGSKRPSVLTTLVNVTIIATALIGAASWAADAASTRDQALRKYRRMTIHLGRLEALAPDDVELAEAHRTLDEIGARLAARDWYGRAWALVTCRSSLNSLDRMEEFARAEERERKNADRYVSDHFECSILQRIAFLNLHSFTIHQAFPSFIQMAMLYISIYDATETEMNFFIVKDDSEATKALIEKKAGVVFVDMYTTARRAEDEKENASIELKATKGQACKRRKVNIPPPRDEHLQKLIDSISEWYESEGREEPEGDVGTFAQAPKNLMPPRLDRVGITEREDSPILTVVGVYKN